MAKFPKLFSVLMALTIVMGSTSVAASACCRHGSSSSYDDYYYWDYRSWHESPPTINFVGYSPNNNIVIYASDNDNLSNINIEERSGNDKTLLNKNITVSGKTAAVSAPLVNGARTVIVIATNYDNYTAEKTLSAGYMRYQYKRYRRYYHRYNS